MEKSCVDCADFKFYSNFDSANFARVEHVAQQQQENGSKVDIPSATNNVSIAFEFNVWTRPDCAGTEYENGNRTWFYFGIKAAAPSTCVRLNIIDINKQAKMYSQGMAPVFKVVPGKPIWERVRDKLTYSTSNDNIFSVSFKYKTPENPDAIVYFAFTYPYSYTDLQNSLRLIDDKYLHTAALSKDDIYYVRECVCKSVECRRIDLLTISSYHNVTNEREDRLQNLFPDKNVIRPFKFTKKKVIFVSARVHPGETPSTFVLNGLLNLLLSRDDPVALVLRRHYVFKLIPFLNPDGVSRGHYRTDTNGINLNRVYLQPTIHEHPSVYAARSLLRYHHYDGREVPDPQCQQALAQQQLFSDSSTSNQRQPGHLSKVNAPLSPNVDASNVEIVVERDVSTLIENTIVTNDTRLSNMSLTEEGDAFCAPHSELPTATSKEHQLTFCKRLNNGEDDDHINKPTFVNEISITTLRRLTTLGYNTQHTDETAPTAGDRGEGDSKDTIDSSCGKDIVIDDSGLFLYVDMHGHASKKGIFMYGNHFDNIADSVECMLLPKIMSLNNHNFHFTACNFTERNMYLKDRRDGMSREGSGRVAVLKLTGLVRSYTLECNYNTGRLTNQLPPTLRESSASGAAAYSGASIVPPKYNPQVYEDVGRALGASILDLTGQNPLTRLTNSEFHSLTGLRHWLGTNCAVITIPTSPIIHHTQQLLHNTVDGAILNAAVTSPGGQQQQQQVGKTPSAGCHPIDSAGGKVACAAGAGIGRRATVATSSQGSWRSAILVSSTTKAPRYRAYHHRGHLRSYLRNHGGRCHGGNTRNVPSTKSSRGGNNIKKICVSKSGGMNRVATAAMCNAMPTAASTYSGRRVPTLAVAAASTGTRQPPPGLKARSATVGPTGPGSTSNSRRLKLREICWIRGGADTGQGKALIAKYTTSSSVATSTSSAPPSAAVATVGGAPAPILQAASCSNQRNDFEENLIVSWDANNANPQVFAQRTSIVGHIQHGTASNSRSIKSTTAAITTPTTTTTTNKRPAFRVHNFRRRQHHFHQHPIITMTAAAAGTATVLPPAGTTVDRQHNRLRPAAGAKTKLATKNKLKEQSTAMNKDTMPPDDDYTAATALAVPNTNVSQHQIQSQHKLQRGRRKRKRTKSGLVAVH